MTNLSKLILLLVLTTATLTAQENQNELFLMDLYAKTAT